MKVFVVIPAYNEERRIRKVLKSLAPYNYKVIVVDDGSSDNTISVVEKFKSVLLLVNKKNQGQGASLRKGINRALKEGADIIINFDADGQHRASEISKFVKPILRGEVDVVLGSRFLRKNELPLSRKILLKGSIFVERFFLGVKLSDAHNGFRAFSRSAARKIKIRENRMAHASEIVKEIGRLGLKYKEIPVNIKYNQDVVNKGSGSYLTAVKVGLRILSWKFSGK
tara:strand:+ start:306 stop:983 length:678 start_codon:yes stop_codon:yes gene_type:complete